jgi:ATP-dependent Clp protease adaptor protein ClpS
MSTKEITKTETITKEQVVKEHEIVLFNDDVNTFDHVIETLMLVCHHTSEQAEQCALLVHYKGQCTVKTGALKDLKPKCIALLSAGLSAQII